MRKLPKFIVLVAVAGCATSASVGSPAPDASTTYVVRRGTDTIAVEQYSRAGNRVEATQIQREPSTFLAHSNIEMGANGLMRSWRFEQRLVSGARPANGATVTWTFSSDSSFSEVVRDTGAALFRRVAGGPAVPALANSMLTNNLAIAYARLQNTDSVNVPTMGTGGARGTIPIRFVTRDSVRVWYFGAPMYAKLDADGQIRWLDGAYTANKIMALKTNRIDVQASSRAYAARDAAGSGLGPASLRDTTRTQIAGNQMWVDYSRPRLSGRNVWSNGVLGDTLWRTGANNATHFYTQRDIRMNGVTIPAGTYTLWTRVFPGNSRYELIVNRRIGQWGTELPNPAEDLARIPLRERTMPNSAERVTISIEPGGDGGVLAIQWGTKRLEAPFTIVR